MTQRRFWPLFVLLQSGTFNDNLLKNALIGMITFGGVVFLADLPSAIRVPVAGMIFTGPFLLVCAIAGQIADKYDRAKILRNVKRAELLIMLLTALGFWLGNFPMLVIALAGMGAQSAFFSPTKNAGLPQWLEEDELITGNALLNGFVYVLVLVGMVFGLMMSDTSSDNPLIAEHGHNIIACVLLFFAIIGWAASKFQTDAPAPKPDLKINFEPVTATWSVLRTAFKAPPVLRPMLGIAWFYGLSTILITTLPNYVAEVMGYNSGVLINMLVISTIGILIGSLLCMVLANGKRFGRESVGLTAIGITGVVLCTIGLYIYMPTEPVARIGGKLPGMAVFKQSENAHLLLGLLFTASMFNGMFVVPLQAMPQRRADPAIRARLMSAGSVLLNIFVNFFTFGLIWMAYQQLPPKTPFLAIIIISFFVMIYAIYRTINPHHYKSHVGED